MAAKLGERSAAVFACAFALVSCSSKATKPVAPPAMSLMFPSTVVPAGIEKTQCVVLRLGNVAPLHVGAVHNVLGEASHHLIVYKVNDTVEQPTPFPCKPFTDTLDPSKGSTTSGRTTTRARALACASTRRASAAHRDATYAVRATPSARSS
jgi:hypothetical protein